MNKKNNLVLGRAIFTILIIVAFGTIIMTEKGGEIFSPKIKEKLEKYIDENYSSINSNITKSNVSYNNKEFNMIIHSKQNKNLSFHITYSKGKITDTYKKDYQEGNSLLTYLKEKLQKEVQEKTSEKCSIKPITTLDQYSEKVKEKIIKEEDLLSLKFYYIEKEITINDWTVENITNEITSLIEKMNQNNITPKYYKITIVDNKDITKAIEINHITEDFINLDKKEIIINDILQDNNSDNIKNNKITYKYLN